MSEKTEALVDSFASQLKGRGVAIRREDNLSRLQRVEARLPKRLPPSFESLLSRYSFSSFDTAGIAFLGWGAESTELLDVMLPQRGSLSEILLPAGYLQFGRPDTGGFDAVCLDINEQKQNREYRIVLADHEEILCCSRVKIHTELFPSFRKFLETSATFR